jgi:hypothetical protein
MWYEDYPLSNLNEKKIESSFKSRPLIFVRTDLNLFVLLSECFPNVVLSSDVDWRGGDRENCGSLASMDVWRRGDKSSRDETSIWRMSQTVGMTKCTSVFELLTMLYADTATSSG